ncbi:MAG: topoisomerase C-terminal repeat-containing protein, partial [Rubricoccaceae bacterium]|nr:topoisomerase C-terminal repeat-containing protein [Rubricoccaceae bacterium]
TDPTEVDLDMAVRLLMLPRTLGEHPETGNAIKANIGRFGPYVQHGSTFASLKEDHVLDVTLDRALELIAEKQKKNEPLRLLGVHPDTNEPIGVYSGRYGPYVKHLKTNATIPKDNDPDTITLEEAVVLINEKLAKKGKGRGRKKKAKA